VCQPERVSIESIMRNLVREELQAALASLEPPAASSPAANRWMNEQECADLVSIPTATLRNWRFTGAVQLPFARIGRLVRYSEADVQAFMGSRKVE
jgi:predicted DNA-binding transcriptional regulator AlpA